MRHKFSNWFCTVILSIIGNVYTVGPLCHQHWSLIKGEVIYKVNSTNSKYNSKHIWSASYVINICSLKKGEFIYKVNSTNSKYNKKYIYSRPLM